MVRTKTPQRAEKMLAAAAELFSGQHFHQVRMQDIATAASVGKGTLYRYFADKDELYLALLGRSAEQAQNKIVSALQRAVSGREKLEALVTAGLAIIDDEPNLQLMIQRGEVLRGRDSPWQSVRDAYHGWAFEVFREAEAVSEFRVRNPERAALMFVGAIRHLALFGPTPRDANLARDVVRDFLDGFAE